MISISKYLLSAANEVARWCWWKLCGKVFRKDLRLCGDGKSGTKPLLSTVPLMLTRASEKVKQPVRIEPVTSRLPSRLLAIVPLSAALS